MATRETADRRLIIIVRNEVGVPMVGATVEVIVGGVLAGTVTTSGNSTIQINAGIPIELKAAIGPFAVTANVAANASLVELVLPTDRAIELAAVATARCANGKEGQPCVTCEVLGRPVRICA